MNRTFRSTLTVVAAAAVVAIAVPAVAGPPLLCHPYDIGTARSLPWSGANSWWEGASGYQVDKLVADTEALLTPATPVIVRMETLRRAAIYASTDQAVAARLLQALLARVEASRGTGGQADPLALLDAAYVAGAYRELTMMGNSPELRNRVAGVRAALGTTAALPLIAQSVAARPDDPSIRFAAALIAADSDRTSYETHAARARAGAGRDPLLARNIKHVS
jgi:hypothetical protein